jgi:serine/threonine protein kinase
MSLAQDSRIGSYKILSGLGSGGMGEVYRARDLKLGRDVAIKVLRREYAADQNRLARFEREARAASALNHPNIVTIYEIGHFEEIPFIAMELVDGKTMRDEIQSGSIPISKIIDVATQAAEGLAKAHEAGIVHRDLKPENLMLTVDGFVKILDFGLAKLAPRPLDADSEMVTLARGETRAGALLGTIEYMSPEQASGATADHRADQFALGVVLYEMIAGKRPFERPTAAQTLAAIIEATPASLYESRPDLSRGLAEIVERCLEKKPSSRYEATRELARALRSLSREPVDLPERSALPEPQTTERALLRQPMDDVIYYVQTDDRVQRMSGHKLRRSIRRKKFSGLELVRREGQNSWEPLHDNAIFIEEVPMRGDHRDAARWRLIQEFGSHLAVFLALGVFLFMSTGHAPYWMAFWGIGLVIHAFRALPAAIALFSERKLRLDSGTHQKDARLPAAAPNALPPAAATKSDERLLSPEFREETARVKELLKRRDPEEGRGLLAEIDRLVTSVAELAKKQKDIEEQTSSSEIERLSNDEAEVHAKLARADATRDRNLYEKQLEVLTRRRRAIDTARRLLERMGVRRSLAEHQLKQLRLDLTQAEAQRLDTPQLSSRILDIRREVDALDEIDEMLAGNS